MFTSDPTRHLDSDVESAHRPSKPKGRVPLVVTAVGLGFVMASLSVSAGRLTYERSGDVALDMPSDAEDVADYAVGPDSGSKTDRATAVLRSLTGPGEASGFKLGERTRSQFIQALRGAGLTVQEAASVIDSGLLPASLRREIRSVENAGLKKVAGKLLDEEIVDALKDLSTHMSMPITAGSGKHRAARPEAPAKVRPHEDARADRRTVVTVPDENGSRSNARARESEGVYRGAAMDIAPPEDDFEYSDALGDLVDALNPFQSWSRSAFSVYSVMAPSFSEATGEVKVTVTTETRQGVTITTEITKSVESDIPTLVTRASDTRTGKALTGPITAQAPSVETVSAVAFGQLAQGYFEAKAEQKEQRDEPAAETRHAQPAAPADAEAQEPQAPVSEHEKALEAEAPSAHAESAQEGSEAGDGLPGEPLGDLPQHAAA
ncbi:hypothetical protein G6W61_10075 [Streptomyces sp. KAI-26]|uniref:hypothetical protein n=1 Tax=Streptomyces sp. KAI-26 TaxID=1169747 RepID=UPI0015875F53|nr:hypothetical protein [Streptomyces sp. KAI-26]NUV86554.1 hypothetical protein [Streptomyces sp. KAI-26]NUW21251.1 hypothetical protein [Streptomyces roseoviolaceus]